MMTVMDRVPGVVLQLALGLAVASSYLQIQIYISTVVISAVYCAPQYMCITHHYSTVLATISSRSGYVDMPTVSTQHPTLPIKEKMLNISKCLISSCNPMQGYKVKLFSDFNLSSLTHNPFYANY